MKLLDQLNTMERLDQLIRLKATGNLETLSVKLRISVSTIKRQIELMKSLGAPIIYNFSIIISVQLLFFLVCLGSHHLWLYSLKT